MSVDLGDVRGRQLGRLKSPSPMRAARRREPFERTCQLVGLHRGQAGRGEDGAGGQHQQDVAARGTLVERRAVRRSARSGCRPAPVRTTEIGSTISSGTWSMITAVGREMIRRPSPGVSNDSSRVDVRLAARPRSRRPVRVGDVDEPAPPAEPRARCSAERVDDQIPTGTASAPSTTSTMAIVEMTRRRRTVGPADQPSKRKPTPAHGDDHRRRVGVVTDLPAQRRDVRVERARRTPVVLVPHRGHDLLAGERGVGTAHQQRQQVELLRGQLDLAAVEIRAPARFAC